jgi:hypothetical protein
MLLSPCYDSILKRIGSKEGNSASLSDTVDQVVAEDLELDKLAPGFGVKKTHILFQGSQLIIGKSADDKKERTGSDFHCAAGNNYFVQVVGTKKWEFIAPEYSPFMSPLKGGIFNMWNGNPDMEDLQHYIPSMETTLYAGDML